MALKVFSKGTKGIALLIAGIAFILLVTQAAGQSLTAQLPAKFFEEYGTPMLVIEPKNGSIRLANPAAAAFYGYSVTQLQSMHIQQINALDEDDVTLERERAQKENRNYFIFPHRLASGDIRTVEVRSWPLKADNGETLLFSLIIDVSGQKISEASILEYKDRLESLAESRYQQLASAQKRMNLVSWTAILIQLLAIALLVWNIAKRHKSERKLREKTTMLEGLLDSIPDMIFFKAKNGRYLGGNVQFANFVSHDGESVAGKTDFDFFPEQRAKNYRSIDQQVIDTREVVRTEEWILYPDGSKRLIDKLKGPLLDASNNLVGVIGISRDNTEQYQNEQRVKFLAYYDPLTNLPNRYLFEDRLAEICAQLVPGKALIVVAMLDIDHFKNVNDALGHVKGDELLIAIASRLNKLLGDNEVLARFGGDEFVLLLVQENDDLELAEHQLEQKLQHFQDTLAQPMHLGDSELLLGSSLGASFNSIFDRSFAELLKEADIALYAAKDAGRGTWRRFQMSMQTQAENRFALEGELRKAIDNQQLSLYLQPKTDRNGIVYGTESLVRWEHPEKGLIYPNFFIPLAEDTGLIVALGEWVLKETLLLMRENPQLTFAVNISPREFRDPEFVDRVRHLLEETGADPARLTMEVTEGLLITDFSKSYKRMLTLQQMGISFSIDDFGTGYSSLSYLKRLPINELKIDRSFVKDLPHDSSDALLVETMMAIANNLGLSVVAEGVETKEQQAYLYSIGCTLHQGYLYGKPEPAGTLLAKLKSL